MFNKKGIRIFLKGQAKQNYIKLQNIDDKKSKSILNSIRRTKERLKHNPQFGQPISKRLIPKEFKQLGISNLYRIELSDYWRMLYTIEGNQFEIYIFILSITDHKEYNRLFGYD